MTPSQFITALRRELSDQPVYVVQAPGLLSRDRGGTWTEPEKASLIFCARRQTDVVVLATFASEARRDGLSIEIMGGLRSDRQKVAKLVDRILAPVGVEEGR